MILESMGCLKRVFFTFVVLSPSFSKVKTKDEGVLLCDLTIRVGQILFWSKVTNFIGNFEPKVSECTPISSAFGAFLTTSKELDKWSF